MSESEDKTIIGIIFVHVFILFLFLCLPFLVNKDFEYADKMVNKVEHVGIAEISR